MSPAAFLRDEFPSIPGLPKRNRLGDAAVAPPWNLSPSGHGTLDNTESPAGWISPCLTLPCGARSFCGMARKETLSRILEGGVVAVIRARSGELLVDVAEALLAGGVTVMEVTFTVPFATRILEQVADRLGDKIILGAGTVLDAETARAAMLAGADFIVAPNTNLDVIRSCRRYSKVVMPGALTPTEVIAAWEAGADIVKIFPSDFVGPAYLKALHGPLPQIRLMPTGGVNLDTAAHFLRAGACALGIGSSLVDPKAIERGDLSRVETLAREYVRIVAETRQELQSKVS